MRQAVRLLALSALIVLSVLGLTYNWQSLAIGGTETSTGTAGHGVENDSDYLEPRLASDSLHKRWTTVNKHGYIVYSLEELVTEALSFGSAPMKINGGCLQTGHSLSALHNWLEKTEYKGWAWSFGSFAEYLFSKNGPSVPQNTEISAAIAEGMCGEVRLFGANNWRENFPDRLLATVEMPILLKNLGGRITKIWHMDITGEFEIGWEDETGIHYYPGFDKHYLNSGEKPHPKCDRKRDTVCKARKRESRPIAKGKGSMRGKNGKSGTGLPIGVIEGGNGG